MIVQRVTIFIIDRGSDIKNTRLGSFESVRGRRSRDRQWRHSEPLDLRNGDYDPHNEVVAELESIEDKVMSICVMNQNTGE